MDELAGRQGGNRLRGVSHVGFKFEPEVTMAFDPTSHYAKAVVTVSLANNISQFNPPRVVQAQDIVDLVAAATAYGLSCREAYQSIVSAGAARNYSAAYLMALENAYSVLVGAPVAMVTHMSDGALVTGIVASIAGTVALLHDPINLGLAWPPPIVGPTPTPTPTNVPQHPHWMQDYDARISQRTLASLVLPGTHDSGTYAIAFDSTIANDGNVPTWVNFAYGLPVIGRTVTEVIASWAKTQALTIGEQLNAGIRFFDLRVLESGGEYYMVHTLFSANLNDALSDIAAFLRTNTKEIIILDFQHIYDVANQDDLFDKINFFLGPWLAARPTFSTTSRVADLWACAARVIVLYEDQPTVNRHPQLWSRALIRSEWPNTASLTDLQTKLRAELNRPNPSANFLVLQGILTPDGSTIAKGLMPGFPGSMAALAPSVTPTVTEWIQQWANNNPAPNIVIADWFTADTDFVDKLTRLNLWPGAMKSKWSSSFTAAGSGGAWLSGDINKDGVDELVQAWNNGSDGLGLTALGWSSTAQSLSILGSNQLAAGAGALRWLIGDINKDGQDEVIQVWSDDSGNLGLTAYGWSNNAFSILGGNSPGTGAAGAWLIGDINNDGQAELIQLWAKDDGGLGLIAYGWSAASSTFSILGSSQPANVGAAAVQWLVGDINKDNKVEVIQVWDKDGQLGLTAFNWTGTAFAVMGTTLPPSTGSAGHWLIGDVNGDGQAELVQLWNNGSNQLGIAAFKWANAAFSLVASSQPTGAGSAAVSWLIGDVNGDGRDEILQQWDNGGSLGVTVYGFTGAVITTYGSTSNIGAGSGALAWLTAHGIGGNRDVIVQVWPSGSSLGLTLFDYETS
ncbi:MAG: hypothetical protein JNN30_13630 [Rhodanobacteraceae bacterium]|nr:hypothetical protein [Rhodanobacteraceae bacterium]